MRQLRKGYVNFDEQRKNTFLDQYSETGLQAHAAAIAGVSVNTVILHRKKDKAFSAAYEDAFAMYCDSLVAEAVRRGHTGMEEPLVFQGKKTGHTIRRYSDRLLERLLEAKVPGFGKKLEVDATVKGGVLLVHSAAKDVAAWQDQYNGDDVIDTESQSQPDGRTLELEQ